MKKGKPDLEVERDRKLRERAYQFDTFCPTCGARMVRRINRTTQEPFLGCTRYPDCVTTSEIESHFVQASHTAFWAVGASVSPAADLMDSSPVSACNVGNTERWEQIARQAAKMCGGTGQALRWLETPKVALRGRKPIDLLGTEDGCDDVEALLWRLAD